MKAVDKRNKEKLTYDDVKVGEAFICDDILYIKIFEINSRESGLRNSICLVTGNGCVAGGSEWIGKSCEVEIPNVEITIQ